MEDGALAPATLSPTTASPIGSSGVAVGDVLGPGGVAVERGLVEGGQRARADDLLRAEQALGVQDRELDGVRLRNGRQDLVEVPLHGADLREPLRQLHRVRGGRLLRPARARPAGGRAR